MGYRRWVHKSTKRLNFFFPINNELIMIENNQFVVFIGREDNGIR